MGFVGDWFESALKGWAYYPPEWLNRYKDREYTICKKTGLTEKQLRHVVDLFKEYGILEREGKRS